MLKYEISTMHGEPFINLIHDMWTSNGGDSILGVSISFISQKWQKVYVALFLKKHKGGHSAINVSTAIKTRLREEYPDIDIDGHIFAVASDTTASARNVANDFDGAAQIYCVMHATNLGTKYALGLKENRAVINGEKKSPHSRSKWHCVYRGLCSNQQTT